MQVLPARAIHSAKHKFREHYRRQAAALDYRATNALIPQMRPIVYHRDRPDFLETIEKDEESQFYEWLLCRRDTAHWCHNWAYVYDWDRNLVRFSFNAAQWYIYTHHTAFTIGLKARRSGWTLLFQEDHLHDTIFWPNMHALLIAHKKEETRRIFARGQITLKMLPDWMRPEMSGTTKYGLDFIGSQFAPRLDSYCICATAGSEESGRGADADRLHLSEFAYYPNPEGIMAGAVHSTRSHPRVVIESTGEPGSEMETQYRLAEKGASRFRPLFIPWFYDPLKREPAKNHPDLVLSPEIEELATGVDLNQAQKVWWQLMKNELKVEAYRQNPSTPEDAFSVGESPYYDAENLKSIRSETLEIIRKSLIIKPTTKTDPDWYGTRFFNQHGDEIGGIYVYERPRPDWEYRVGADCSEGVGQDESALTVLDAFTKKQVCVAHYNRWDPHDFAHTIWKVCCHYGGDDPFRCPVLIERNAQGQAVIEVLRQLLYEAIEDESKEDLYLAFLTDPERKRDPKIGFETHRVSRDRIMALSVVWVNKRWITIVDFATVEQARQITYNQKKHRWDHPSTGRDDILFSTNFAAALAFDPSFAWAPEQGVHQASPKSVLEAWVAEHDHGQEEATEATEDLIGTGLDGFADEYALGLLDDEEEL